LAEFGYNALVREEGKVVKGELINCIHHPEGQARQVSLRENRLMALLELWIHYETDTSKGSSGAPLYNNQWQIVGLHHAAVEKRDEEGNILAIGGGKWQPEMGERQKWWYANEGLRISRFIADVEAQVETAMDSSVPPVEGRIVTEEGYMLFQGMLNPPQNVPVPTPRPIPPSGSPVVTPPERRRFNPE
jgi:endonuclease G